MKHHLLTAIIMALSFVPSISKAYDFEAVNDDGVTIYYNIISEEEKTCEVTKSNTGYYEGDIKIPSFANNYRVVSINYAAFYDYSNKQKITSITIPKTITEIKCFFSPNILEQIVVEEGNPCYNSDNNCNAIIETSTGTLIHGCKNTVIPETVKKIGNSAFYGCKNMTSIDIPNTVSSIGLNAFEGCSKLTEVNIPSSVTNIESYAFSNCSSLKSVSLPNTLNYLNGSSFELTPWWESYKNNVENQYENIVYINDIAVFLTSNDIDNCTLKENTRVIASSLFGYCPNLTSVEIPNSVEIIDDFAFINCENLSSVKLPNSVKRIGQYAFSQCPNLIDINIPNSVTTIDMYAFCDCKSLTSIHIPASVTSIGEAAFWLCPNLYSIDIPNSVTNIGDYVFGDCTGLTSITSYITDVFEVGMNTFLNCDNATLYVPKGMSEIYKATAGWNTIKNIEEIPSISMQLSCNTKGSVSINDTQSISSKIAEVSILENADNTFTFAPKPNCRLDQVVLNGLDITANVEGNTLTCTIPANSQMIVTFTTEQGDLNNDGTINISDVVAIVNKILGN